MLSAYCTGGCELDIRLVEVIVITIFIITTAHIHAGMSRHCFSVLEILIIKTTHGGRNDDPHSTGSKTESQTRMGWDWGSDVGRLSWRNAVRDMAHRRASKV